MGARHDRQGARRLKGDFRDKDFQERLYLDDDASIFLAQSTGFQSGCIGVVHNLLRSEQHVRGALGVALVHEMKIDVNTLRLAQVVGRTMNDFGYGLDDCRVWRYWDDPPSIRTAGPSVKTLAMARAGRAMVVLSSFGPTGEARLDLDLKMLGLSGEVVAVNAETGERIDQPAPGSFALTVPRHDFRLLLIEPAAGPSSQPKT